MNFFRKKDSAFITLETHDFGPDAAKLWADLMFALEGHKLSQVTLKLYDAGDLPMKVLTVILSFGLKLREENVTIDVEASARLIQMIRRLNFVSAFSHLAEIT